MTQILDFSVKQKVFAKQELTNKCTKWTQTGRQKICTTLIGLEKKFCELILTHDVIQDAHLIQPASMSSQVHLCATEYRQSYVRVLTRPNKCSSETLLLFSLQQHKTEVITAEDINLKGYHEMELLKLNIKKTSDIIFYYLVLLALIWLRVFDRLANSFPQREQQNFRISSLKIISVWSFALYSARTSFVGGSTIIDVARKKVGRGK